jgi:hypothetical protein
MARRATPSEPRQPAQENFDLEKPDFASYWMPKALMLERVACDTVSSEPAG